MSKRKPPRPEWAIEYLQLPTWKQREFLRLLCGLSPDGPRVVLPNPQEDPDGFREVRRRHNEVVAQDERKVVATDRYVKRAIRRGLLPVLPSLANERLLDKVRPCLDDETIAEFEQAVAADRAFGNAYDVDPHIAIRRALGTGRFPQFPYSLEDIPSLDKGKPPALAKPLVERERLSLLRIIRALANEADIDISKPSKAAEAISAMTDVFEGGRVAPRTIAGHLKRIQEEL